MTPRKFVRLFKPEFAPLVESGAKTRTVRPTPKRMPRLGDLISLRCWTGKPYRSKQRVLREAVITAFGRIHITQFGISHVGPILRDSLNTPATYQYYNEFARADGFKDFDEMRDWFEREHSLPFSGIMIFWK